MTPKEKAEELFFKFRKLESGESWINNTNAKQCALIAVDEILNNDGFTRLDIYLTEYWQEVKQEIEKL